VDSRRAGFSFVELLVALVISSILGLVVFQVLLSQGRFNRMFSAREEVQQNVRTGLDVLASDLRAVGPGQPQQGAGIVAADANALQLRVVRAWGYVCGLNSGRLVVMFPDAAVGALATVAGARDSLAYTISAGGQWAFEQVSDLTSANLGDAESLCNTALTPIPTYAAATWTSSPVRAYNAPNASAAVAVGQQVYLFDRVNYSVGADPQGRVPGLWLLRGDDAQVHPLAGPLPDGQALGFTYFGRNSTDPPMTVPLATQAARDDVFRVRVRLETVSSGRISGRTDTEVESLDVLLRNRVNP
jgi:prepilin-type N-terminal cleavage/methylation domain-containing protein